MRRNRKRSGFQWLRKFLRELLIRLGFIRSRRSHSSQFPIPGVQPTATQLEAVQPNIQQNVQTVDHGGVVVGSISNVTGNVYIGGRPRPGIPFQIPPLPAYYVDRREVRERLKSDLFGTDVAQAGTLVVSAVYGLGGIGKSVLAAAIAGEREVQETFPDGVLWVTLGQEPQVLEELGNWIQAVGDRDYKPTTIDGASRHLRSLLFEKQMLLVVDDVWNWSDGEPFQVGGTACRVLVTTREAHIPGAVKIDLAVMNDDEAIALLEGYLKQTLTGDDRRFALELKTEVAGLPLALELAAAQIADGLDWDDLLRAFREEVARLEILDAPDFDPSQQEKTRKQRSLQASFNLSLKRLTDEGLKQFVMMGVLPEDVSVGAEAMATIWDVTIEKAKKTLRELRRRSLLLDGVTRGEAKTYRMHDLVHDTAMNLMLQTLGLGIDEVHNLVLDRYRITACTWFLLRNDGYIHSHLTWHLEKARREADIHELMVASDERGKSTWFETCDKLGQPAIFVQDIARAWRLAEQFYPYNPCQSIVLQCRYALIMGTMNSLLNQLTGNIFSVLVESKFWSIEQAWAYVNSMQDERMISIAISHLSSTDLTQTLFFEAAVEKARSLQNAYSRAFALKSLAQINSEYCTEALKAARLLENASSRIQILNFLAQIDSVYCTEFMEATQSIEDASDCAWALSSLVKINSAFFPEVLEVARSMKKKFSYAHVLSSLAEIDSAFFPEALEAVRSIEDKSDRARALSSLVKIDSAFFPEALEAARLIENELSRVHILINLTQILINLTQINSSDLSQLLEVARSIEDAKNRADILHVLAHIDSAYFPEALEVARSIEDAKNRADILSSLAEIDSAYFSEALEATRSIEDREDRLSALSYLAYIDSGYCIEALETARLIQDQSSHAEVLIALTKIDSSYFAEALKATRSIQLASDRAAVLIALTKIDSSYFVEALKTTRSIQPDFDRAESLKSLAQIDSADLSQLLEASRSIQNEYDRAEVLKCLAQRNSAYFAEALEVAQSIQDIPRRAEILIALAHIDSADLSQLLEAAQSIQSEYYSFYRAKVLIALAKIDSVYSLEAWKAARSGFVDRKAKLIELAQIDYVCFYEVLESARLMEDDVERAEILISLVKIDSDYFSEALEAVQAIQDEYRRASSLSDLARIDLADFSQLLEAAQLIQDDSNRSRVLSALAQINSADFSQLDYVNFSQLTYVDFAQLLEATRSIQKEFDMMNISRTDILASLANTVPQDLLPNLYKAITEITHNPSQAKALSSYISRLPLDRLPYTDWKTYLHLLAHRTRVDLMSDLATLYPAILHLGGEDSGWGTVEEMGRVCRQWN